MTQGSAGTIIVSPLASGGRSDKVFNIIVTLVAQVPAVAIGVLTLPAGPGVVAVVLVGLVVGGALIACLVWVPPRRPRWRGLALVLVAFSLGAGLIFWWLGIKPPPAPKVEFLDEPGICRPVLTHGEVRAGMELWVGVKAQSSDDIYFQGPMTQVGSDGFRKVVALGDPQSGAGQTFTIYVIEVDVAWANYLTTTDPQDRNSQTWVSRRFPPEYVLVGSGQTQRTGSTVDNC